MKKLITLCLFITLLFLNVQANDDPDYTQGVIFVNEDWYGHQNGTVNYLSDTGEWTYRIFQKSNPGKELGATPQFGTIYGDRMYIICKQERDPGASVTGSRFAVCDAKTFKCIKEFTTIATDSKGKSIADGRSFLGVDEHKGYIGTSNGIYPFDIDKMEIGEQIKGTGNPNGSGYGQLYYAQIGTMLRIGDRVFAVHQQEGLKIIDAKADTLIQTITAPQYEDNGKLKPRGFGAIVQSKDGNLWISMAKDVSGSGATIPYIFKVNPYTLATDLISIPVEQGIEEIPNSWYAWTADPFCSSAQENKIYWCGNNGNSWFKNRRIFCYDIDNDSFSRIMDFESIPGKWIVYGAAFRIHPVTDELYCGMFHEFLDPAYEVMRISNKGDILQEYPMITNYWFPALPVFPDNYAPEITKELNNMNVEEQTRVWLGDKVTDKDNQDAAIIKSIESISDENILKATVRNDSLILAPSSDTKGYSDLTLTFNSNGKITTKTIQVHVNPLGSVGSVVISKPGIRYSSYDNTLMITTDEATTIQVFSISGQYIYNSQTDGETVYISASGWEKGVYIVKIGTYNTKIVIQ